LAAQVKDATSAATASAEVKAIQLDATLETDFKVLMRNGNPQVGNRTMIWAFLTCI
jgi:hypothetical protein